MILGSCMSCDTSTVKDKVELQTALQENDVTLHLISELNFKIVEGTEKESQKKTMKVYGYNKDLMYQQSGEKTTQKSFLPNKVYTWV